MPDRTHPQRPTPTISPDEVLTYTNRMGDTYYLHEGRTKSGKVRYYVAKSVRDGALSSMPEGFEFTESVNGVVSVRRIDPDEPGIPEADLALVRAELARHHRLRLYRTEVVKGEILVFEPSGGMSSVVMSTLNRGAMPPSDEDVQSAVRQFRLRYEPVLKFAPSDEEGEYSVQRMTYRGDGGWSWTLAWGALGELVETYLPRLGTDEFFELF